MADSKASEDPVAPADENEVTSTVPEETTPTEVDTPAAAVSDEPPTSEDVSMASEPAVEEASAPSADEPVAETTPTTPDAPVPTATPAAKSSGKPKWFMAAVAAGLVLVIGGGSYGYFGIYTQTPENLWKSSLKNSRDGLQAFVNQGPSTKKGVKVSGNFKMTLPLAADGSVSGSVYDQSSDIKVDVGAGGIRANLELRTIPFSGAKNPDVYLNITGIKSLAALAGADSQLAATIDSLDGKWLVADHTLIDQALQSVGSSAPSTLTNETPEQIVKDLQDIEKKVTTVLSERLFTDDKTKAVVVIKDKLAKEDFQGRKSQHLRVQVQKKQLHDFAVAMKDALKTSKLNGWIVGADKTKTFEEITDFDALLKSIDGANYDKAIADVWVDTGTKTIRNVRIYDSANNTKSYVDLTFNYTGGDDYPFIMHIVGPTSSSSTDVTFGMTLNRKTYNLKYALAITAKDAKGNKTADATGSLELTPTDDKLKVEKPANATNIVNLLGGFLGQIQDVQNQLKVVNPSNSSFLDDMEGTNLQ